MLLFIPMIADSYPTASCQYALPQIAALLCHFFSIIPSRCFSSFLIYLPPHSVGLSDLFTEMMGFDPVIHSLHLHLMHLIYNRVS